MRILILIHFISVCFARLWMPSFHWGAPTPVHQSNILVPEQTGLGGVFNWLFGMGSMFKVQFDLLGPSDSKQNTLPEEKVLQLIADLAKTDKSRVRIHIDGWFKIDITLVARKENIDVIEKAVAEGVFLKDMLGNLKELKKNPGRRFLRKKKDVDENGEAQKVRRHDKRKHHKKGDEFGEHSHESSMKISQRRRIDIPGHGEAEKTYVEISLPTKCDCFNEASQANLVDLVSHITALHRSQIKVQTRPSWHIFAVFHETQPKMGEIQKFYFSGEFEKKLNSKLHEYHILDDAPIASTKKSPELSVADSLGEGARDGEPNFIPAYFAFGFGVLILGSMLCCYKIYTSRRRMRELDLAFIPSENVEILYDEHFPTE